MIDKQDITYTSNNDNPTDYIKEAQLASYPSDTQPLADNVFPMRFMWTREKYYKADDAGIFDNQQVELIEGEIIEMAPTGPFHGSRLYRLSELLRETFSKDFPIRVQSSVSISNVNEPQPDIAVVTGPWRKYDDHNPLSSEICLIIEVSESSLKYDRSVKSKLYASVDIPEFWIVNLTDKQLEVYRDPSGGSYTNVNVYKSGDSVIPLKAEGKSIAIADFLE